MRDVKPIIDYSIQDDLHVFPSGVPYDIAGDAIRKARLEGYAEGFRDGAVSKTYRVTDHPRSAEEIHD